MAVNVYQKASAIAQKATPPPAPAAGKTKQCASLLDQTKWANDFNWSEIEALALYLTLVQAPKGTIIFREGSTDSSLSIIAEGNLNIVKEDTTNQPKVIATIGPAQTLGEMSLLDGGTRSATAIASNDATLLTMTKESLDLMMREKPPLAVKFVLKLARLLSQRLRMTSSTLANRM